MPPSLFSSTTKLLAGRIVGQFSQYTCLVVIARIGTQTEVGYYVTAMAICTPAILFANLQLNVDIATFHGNTVRFSEYFHLRSLLLLASIFLVLIGVASILGRGPLLYTVFGVLAMKLVESLSDLCGAFQLKLDNVATFAKSLSLRGLTMVSSMTLVFALTSNLVFACLAISVCWFMILVLHDLPAAWRTIHHLESRYTQLRPEFNRFRKLARIATRTLPLGVTSLIGSIEIYLPRYIAAALLGLTEAAVLAVGITLSIGVQLIMATSIQVAIPRLAYFASSHDNQSFTLVRRKVLAFTALAGLVQTVGLYLFGHHLIQWLFGDDYVEAVSLLLPVSIASSLFALAAVESSCLRARGYYRTTLVNHVISTMISAAVISVCASLNGSAGLGFGMVTAGFASMLLFTACLTLVTLRPSTTESHYDSTVEQFCKAA